ncbi:protein dispatched homolog 1-like [Lineus longissimus]|uniref:protein dispatched homolog 1-like n=1 Tax=Lineus longissimus TaxID=88925 RepID=UPI00315DA495
MSRPGSSLTSIETSTDIVTQGKSTTRQTSAKPNTIPVKEAASDENNTADLEKPKHKRISIATNPTVVRIPRDPSVPIGTANESKQNGTGKDYKPILMNAGSYKGETKSMEKEKERLRLAEEKRIEERAAMQEELAVIEADHNERKKKKPIRFLKLLCDYPAACFGVMTLLQFLPVFVTGILFAVGYDIIPVSFQALPLNLNNDHTLLEDYAYRGKNIYTDKVTRSIADGVPIWMRGRPGDFLLLFYEKPGGNVFTKSDLQAMQQVEDELFNIAEYQSNFCQLDLAQACVKPTSILRFFDGTYSSVDAVFDDPNFDNIAAVINAAESYNETYNLVQYHLGKTSTVSAGSVRSYITRSFLPIGFPLNADDDSDIQKDKIKAFFADYMSSTLESYASNGVHGMNFLYYANMIFFNDIMKQALLDMALVMGSLVFIFVLISVQTGSLWITSWAVFGILSSFVTTNLIYRVVLDFKYFGFFHILSMFIILGIGADDIFVFMDTWKETGERDWPSVAHRLSDAYRRSAFVMFITSLTTMVAFFASGISPLLAVNSFGIFSGILVALNYLTVISFLPTIVIMYEKHVRNWCQCCSKVKCSCTCCNKSEVQPLVDTNGKAYEPDELDRKIEARKPKRGVTAFLVGPFYRFVTHRVARIVIVVFFLAAVAFFGWSASRLGPDETAMKFYVASHNYARARSHNIYSFRESEEDAVVTVHLVWGMKPNDRSGCHRTDFECKGEQVWDDTFDMNTNGAQEAIDNLCNTLRNLDSAKVDELKIATEPTTKQLKISCAMEQFKTFLGTSTSPSLSVPLDSDDVPTFMDSNTAIYDRSSLSADFNNYFEVGIAYWLTNQYNMNTTADFKTYNGLIGEMKTTNTRTIQSGLTGAYYGTKLRFMSIEVNLTLNRQSLGYPVGLPVYESWQNFMKEQLALMPSNLQGGFQCTRGSWHYIKVQKSLVLSAATGIGIGIGLAIPVIFLATCNFSLTAVAILTICFITLGVVGMLPLAGWKLGVLESLNLCLVVGLTVDYVVHMVQAYTHSPRKKRNERVQDALRQVGVSVLCGAITTLGSSFFMLFAKIQFFMQFGLFMFCTIGFAVFYALFFLMSFLSICGPEGDDCSVAPCCKRTGEKYCSCCHGDVTPGSEGSLDTVEKVEIKGVSPDGSVTLGDGNNIGFGDKETVSKA